MYKKILITFLMTVALFTMVGCIENPTTESLVTTEVNTENPTTDGSTDEPTSNVPTTDTPTTDVPTTDTPTTDVPTTDQPTTGVPTTDIPTTEVPTTEEPTTEVPTTEEPTTDTPTDDSYYDNYVDLLSVHDMSDGSDVEVSGVVYFLTQNGYYIKDNTSNLFIYTNSTPQVELGSRVVVDGSLTTYRQVKQIGEDHTLVEVNAYDQDITKGVHQFTYGQTNVSPGEVYTITGEVRIEGQYDTAFLYDGSTKIAEIYYQSLSRSVDAIKSYDGEIITLDLLYYAMGDDVERYAFQGSQSHISVYIPDTQDALFADANALPTEQTLYSNYDYGQGFYGSTYQVTNVSGDIAPYVSYTGSTITVTKPDETTGDVQGTITISVSLEDETPITITINVVVKAQGSSNINMPYYDGIDGLSGETLLYALNSILNDGFNQLSYDDAKWVLEESDRDPNNANNVILVYTRESIKGQWDYPNWNREHTWPQSKLNNSGQKADMHNLKPSDPAENSRRGNLPFGYMTGSGVYEPHDDVKGDVARILFYMATMYLDLNIESGILGDLDVLLEWHQNDPVDDFERNRNEVIYSHQGNRNPFIDYPFLAEEIW
jgi:endonuclease I